MVKRILVVLVGILVVGLVLYGLKLFDKTPQTVTIAQNTVAKQETEKNILWGAYTGESVKDKLDFEEQIGIKPDMIAVFLNWSEGNYFPVELAQEAYSNDQTMVIYFESKENINWNNNDKKYSYDAILSGEWDEYITQVGRSIREAKLDTILIPFVEVNGNWYPWSITKNNNSAEKHKLAYRKIHGLLSDVPNLKMGWAVNNGSAPNTKENSIANLYPGDEYIDYIGVDGFNFGSPWQSFSEVFDQSLNELKKIDKPIMIFSTACAEGKDKAAWIDEMGRQLKLHPEIKGFVWFNEDKEKDWRIWSDPESLSSFQKMIKATAYELQSQ